MKIVVNPTYEHLRKFIESVPDTFEREAVSYTHLTLPTKA